MLYRRRRFPGAGGSAERRFRELRDQNIRDDWKIWAGAALFAVVLGVLSFTRGSVLGPLLAATAGFLAGVLFVLWTLGGHVSAFRWTLGAMGEQETADVLEKLPAAWHCEHDLEHEYGNWDHVLVGPAGVFLLDSKLLHSSAVASGDGLRAGRLRFSGSSCRGNARQVKQLIERRLGFTAPFVRAIIVVWGDFPQGEHEEREVVYLSGSQLRGWLERQPPLLTAAKQAAIVVALGEVRTLLLAALERPGATADAAIGRAVAT